MEKQPMFPTSPQDASKRAAKQILTLRDNRFIPKDKRGYLAFLIALFSCIFGAITYFGENDFIVGFVAGLLYNVILLGMTYIGFRINRAHAIRPEYDWAEEYRE